MVNKESDSYRGLKERKAGYFTPDQKRVRLPGLKRRKARRFTCTMDIFTETSCCYGDKHLGAEGAGGLVIPGFERQKAKIVNLSLSGAKLLAESPVSVGTCLAICLRGSPNTPSIEAKARVVWRKSARLESGTGALDQNYVGVAFQDLRWRQRFQLKKFLKRLSKEPSLT